MEFKDYYQTLGLKDTASDAEIKKAYRNLARKFHPDVSSEANAEDRFKEVSEAYEVLKSPEKRAEYDQLRKHGARGGDGSFRPPPGWQSGSHQSEGYGAEHDARFSDFFEQIFGKSGANYRSGRQGYQAGFQHHGEDVHQRLALPLEEVFHGCEKQLILSIPVVDNNGFVNHQRKTLNVKIPSGIGDGQHLRLKGQGAPGIGGGSHGDLLIEIQIAPHPLYHVDGRNLVMQLPVAPWEAALGASVEVPTLNGVVRLKVPQNSQTGNKLKLKGKGMPGSPGGDLIVQLNVVMPDTVSDEAKRLYQQLQQTTAFDPRADLGTTEQQAQTEQKGA